VFDGRNYWLQERALKKQVAESVCVIGSGETAASIVISLLKSHTNARRWTS
jgi:lysine/ornithine N-monooxygenase